MSWLSRAQGTGPAEPPRSALPLRALYRATADGQLDAYLAKHPELITTAVIASLERDLALAIEYGDLDAASLAAEAAGSVHALLGNPAESVARYLELVHLHSSRAQTPQDLRDLRICALVVGSMTVAAGLPGVLAECWLVVAAADLRLVDLDRDDDPGVGAPVIHLLDAMRALADLGELVLQIPKQRRDLGQLERFADALGSMDELLAQVDWPAHEAIGVRALLRRLSRSGAGIVAGGAVSGHHSDASAVARVERALTRLATQLGR